MPGAQREEFGTPSCNNQLDDDCDGLIDAYDEDCQPCTPSQTLGCASGLPGICMAGVKICGTDQRWSECHAHIEPATQSEVCDNELDDDCDGAADAYDQDCQLCSPGDTESCTSAAPGACAPGTRSCQRFADGWDWGPCLPGILPGAQAEDCGNGIDDDCDSLTDAADEDCQACTPQEVLACASGLPGVCNAGFKTCQAGGSWGDCLEEVRQGEQDEICGNGLDDDCDGSIDLSDSDCQKCSPGTQRPCQTGLPGVCAGGQQICKLSDNMWDWGACEPLIAVGTQMEVCDNGQDDDCDGKTDTADDDCAECTPQATRPCQTSFVGVCSAGTQTCTAQGRWGSCFANITPYSQPEICTNNLDDDCDGKIDTHDSDCNECGTGVCEPSENSFNCPQDCCDRYTPCEQTWKGEGQYVCREASGVTNHAWVSVQELTALCALPDQLCTSVVGCDGWSYYCKDLAPASWEQAWVSGSCQCGDGYCTDNGYNHTETCNSCPQDCGSCVCGDGTCSSPTETGSSCPQDCCDAKTPCDQTKMIGGVEHWCRNINSGGWRWTTLAEATATCDQASEICTSTAECGNNQGSNKLYCKAINPANWVPSPCSCGDGYCTPNENGGSCPTDCCDAMTACSFSKVINGTERWCRNINNTGYRWTSLAEATAACDQASEICTSTARCGGTLYYCSAISPASTWSTTCP